MCAVGERRCDTAAARAATLRDWHPRASRCTPRCCHHTVHALTHARAQVYTIGYPVLLAIHWWRNRELIMEDQLLRAKGVGWDRLTNPNA